tara:strand:- start:196 stop:573 length:378 start_codon:yes stop_codon:yes gene_type:complete
MSLKKEVARDLIALGGIPFYLLVVIRSLIGEFTTFLIQLGIAFVLILIISLLIKETNQPLARGLALATFTSLFYKDLVFAIFVGILWIVMIGSTYYLNKEIKPILKGSIVGIIAVSISYFLALSI